MAKIAVRSREQARGTAYFDGAGDPIHLHLHTLKAGARLVVGPLPHDCVAFVWQGNVVAGGIELAAGSSAVIGRGTSLELACAGDEEALVLCFAGTKVQDRTGAVRLLPAAKVPRMAAEPGASGVSGGLHADSDWPGSAVWLHENHFPAGMDLTPEQAARGVHSHSEAEIIFVTAGAMRLGRKLVGPGTALAIAADTLYGFSAGPQGLSFVNFRAAKPGDIRFAHGASISETGYWRERVGRPDYLLPTAA